MWRILVHGGAGRTEDAMGALHRRGCVSAAEAGAAVLGSNGSALDAVHIAVRVLEDDPAFNAGTGGALDADGLVVCDASIMRGEDLAYGAVGAVVGVQNPVDLARMVLDDGRHSLLVAEGAVRWARQRGIKLIDPRRMETERAKRKWLEAAPAETTRDDELVSSTPETVGAVAVDALGHVAAATSTGGLVRKYAGRVGDSPIAGAGTYADDALGAASATGHGETMLKTVFSYQALIRVRRAEASDVLLALLDRATERVGGRGGIIVAHPVHGLFYAKNTAHMGVAWICANGDRGDDF